MEKGDDMIVTINPAQPSWGRDKGRAGNNGGFFLVRTGRCEIGAAEKSAKSGPAHSKHHFPSAALGRSQIPKYFFRR
jgi:hypothetical protein